MISLLLGLALDLLRRKRDLILENLALRQQILVLQRAQARPTFRLADKAFWVLLARSWRHWRRPLRLVRPSTVIAWHRLGWRLYWRWRSRGRKAGRPGSLIVLSLDRRRVIHFNVTDAPSAYWTSLQLTQAFPFDTAPRFLIRDRDHIYGKAVVETLTNLGIAQKVIARRPLSRARETCAGASLQG